MNEQAMNTAHVIAALVEKKDSLTAELRSLGEVYHDLCDQHDIDKARLANLRADVANKDSRIERLETSVSNLKADLKYWTKTAQERLEKITSTQDAQIIISDLQAKSDSDERKIHDLQTHLDLAEEQRDTYKRRADLYSADIHKLSREIEELKANPPYIYDPLSAATIAKQQEEIRTSHAMNETLRWNLRSIRDAVLANTKDV